MNTEFSKLYFACHSQKETVELIHFLDKKAALFVTASAAILGFVNSYLTKPPGLLYIVAALAFVSLSISLAAGFYCVVPRFARNRPKFDDDWIKDNCESAVAAQVHELWVDTGDLQKNIIDKKLFWTAVSGWSAFGGGVLTAFWLMCLKLGWLS